MTLREAAQQALEALEGWDNYGKWVWPESALEQAKRNTTEAITALKAALVEPVQEPVAWQWLDTAHFRKKIPSNTTPSEWRPLFTAPSQRKPLTREEVDQIWNHEKAFPDIYAIARAIERAHGIGGQDETA